MVRLAAPLLLILALLGTASGGLLKPCDCVHRSAAGPGHAAPAHGCCDAGRSTPADPRGNDEDDGCRVCCKGPPPATSPGDETGPLAPHRQSAPASAEVAAAHLPDDIRPVGCRCPPVRPPPRPTLEGLVRLLI